MPDTQNTSHPNVLVTGGCGFLGKALISELLDSDAPFQPGSIRVLDVLDPIGNTPEEVEYIRGDIRDFETVRMACEGIDVVIHSAAIVDWGSKSEKEVYSVNFTGTENVIRACQEQEVSALIFTSSLDVVFTGKPLVNIDETMSYPESYPNMYCRSKSLAEILVKETSGIRHHCHCECGEATGSGINSLSACVIRPSDIWGEGDPYHIGSLINMAKGGFYVRLGNGKSKCQHTYVRNVAYAHLLAAKALFDRKPGVAGSAYFITDGPGSNFFKFFDQIVTGAGYRIWPKNLWLPRWLAYGMGTLNEAVAWLIPPLHSYTPKFSRFAVIYTCNDFTFSSEKASRELGYQPKYNEKEAMEKTIASFRRHGKTV